MPKADGTQWRELYHEVVTSGLCTGCTACIVACPFHVLGYEDNYPVQLQENGPDACSHGDKGCSLCTLACPRFREWESEIDQLMFGRLREPEELIGQYQEIYLARAAAHKIAELGATQGHTEPILRLRVVAGGCSGFSYELGFDEHTADDDHVIRAAGGVRVVVDPRSAPIVEGSTLEFDTALLGGGLKVRNPRAVHECACGDSFSV